MRSIGVLIVRLVVGGLLAGHGAQKLFGAFGGEGVEATGRWMESIRLRPGDAWARAGGASELGGGLLTMLGFLNPLGPVAAMGAMLMAWAKVHMGKPVWVTSGGAELPLTNLAVLSALTLAGPGRLSVDGLLGLHLPRWIGLAAIAGTAATLWLGAREEIGTGLASAKDELAELGAQAGITDGGETSAGFGADGGARPLVGVMDPDEIAPAEATLAAGSATPAS